jgi:hypothetical protein
MTKHRAVVTGYDPDFENPDQTTGRPKGVQTAADMRVSTTFDVLGEGIFALHGVPQVIASPLDTIQITPFMAAIESPLGGFYIIKTTENETVEINLANAGAVKVYVQQQDWELENDLAHADSAVVFGVAYGAAEIPEGALLLFSSTIVAQTSTSGLTFAQEFKWTGAASGQIRVPAEADLDDVAVKNVGIRALALDGSGEWFFGADNEWHETTIANPKLESFLSANVKADGSLGDDVVTADNIAFASLRIGSAERTTNTTVTGTTSTPTQVTGMSLTFTLTESRRIRFSVRSRSVYGSGSAPYLRAVIASGSVSSGTIIGVISGGLGATNNENMFSNWVEATLPAGTHTIKFAATTDSPLQFVADVVG